MANYRKAAKAGVASVLAYMKTIPSDSFNCNFGVHLTDTSGLDRLLGKFSDESQKYGSFIDIRKAKSDPSEELYQLLMRQSTANLRKSLRYKSILLEVTPDDLKTIKYIVPSILNRSSHVVFLVNIGQTGLLSNRYKIVELRIRELLVEIMRCSNSIGNSVDPQLTFVNEDYLLLSYLSSNSKKDCLLNFAQCGMVAQYPKTEQMRIVTNYANIQQRKESIIAEMKLDSMELHQYNLNDLFSQPEMVLRTKQTWAGKLVDLSHILSVIRELEENDSQEDWSFLRKIVDDLEYVNSPCFDLRKEKAPTLSSNLGVRPDHAHDAKPSLKASVFDPEVYKRLPLIN